MHTDLQKYYSEVQEELENDILAYWMKYAVDRENGGFFGFIASDNQINETADKGCILNSRILWTFSTAYKTTGNKEYLKIAEHAYEFLVKFFWDHEFSGLYWMVDYKGNPINTRKQIYNIAFGIYGLSEYFSATGDNTSLELAIKLFEEIEAKAYDKENKGYFEALTREWQPIDDLRLSDKDMNEKKSMNTHLHILEAYTNLLRVWESDKLRFKLKELIEITIDKIIDPERFQFKLFFDEFWNPKSGDISYGHDIEGSWLLFEAAEVLGNEELIKRSKQVAIEMAQKVFDDGIDREFGGLINEKNEHGHKDPYKAWWPQAEALVGFLNAYELTRKDYFLDASYDMWDFTKQYLIDKTHGEWYWRVSTDGKADCSMPKVEPWKCPYHNGRACVEIMSRLNKLMK
ncbi:MAG: AGE family epimerase/isomerase [Clostridia bacterium]|nr:AGE family epimerase/isomerase [Clostridia bacterium]